MDPARKLSPRQRQCLELYWRERATSKEIAGRLGIAPSTVDGYFAEAIQTLGVRDRREAASLLFGTAPAAIGGASPRVEQEGEWRRWLPLRTGARNDLSITARLFWILAIAILCAIGFGALADGVRTVSDIVR